MSNKRLIDNLKARAATIKKEILVLYFAYQHKNLPFLPKLIIILTLGYALSPIDLIPDFIPVIGYLDDLIIVPALIILSIKLLPIEILKESRERAEVKNLKLRPTKVFGVLIILLWIVFVFLICRLLLRIIL